MSELKLTRSESWEPLWLPSLRVKPERDADRVVKRGDHLIIVNERGSESEVTLLCYHLPILGRLSPRSVSKTGPTRRIDSVIEDIDLSRRFLEGDYE